MVIVPEGLRRTASRSAEGRAWLASLPELCTRFGAAWSVRLGSSFDHAHVSFVVGAERGSEPAVLKIPMPAGIELGTLSSGARSAEAAALRHWSGRGAVRLLEHDRATGAMLMERCVPGHTLDQVTNTAEADRIAVLLLHQLHGPAPTHGGYVRLADRAIELARRVAVQYGERDVPFDRWMLDVAVDLLTELAGSAPRPVLLHGDFHHHNVLASGRTPWLAVDPLPMLGDPAYDAVQYLLFRKGDLADPVSDWGAVIDRFCAALHVDGERVKAWMFARLVTDAVAELVEGGISVGELESFQHDLWSARLVHRLRS